MLNTGKFPNENITTIELPEGFEKGQVYTPKVLAIWVATLLTEHLGEDWSGKILDPACGDGELLDAVNIKMPFSKIHGIDIDLDAVQSAQKRLARSASIKHTDMLLSFPDTTKGRAKGFGGLISNPPWGADLLHSPDELRKLGYSLANGQFDSWSLFVEASLGALEVGGVAAFILPDAIFAPEHIATREFIAKKHSIDLIARLGEGIFKGVCRGSAVIVVRKLKPKPNHRIEVFRLAKMQRSAVLSGELDLQEVRELNRHYVRQSRFVSDTKCRWDIDVRATDQNVLGRLEALGGNWAELIIPGRGVELSKKGLVKSCRKCGYATPLPTRPRNITCAGCGEITPSEEMPTQNIIETENKKVSGFIPLIVGEDIDRYELSCSRKIKLNVPGINYKNQEVYKKSRLLVRKTGIGLKATVTKMVAASNQVVFHYVPRSRKFSFYLYYVLGVLSSRTMFAYHLRKSGENEWRSHPYVTPRTLGDLPSPTPDEGTQSWRQANEIANRVRQHLRTNGKNKELDLEIEGLVAGLFHLDYSDLDWVKNVICDAQNLEPMRVLGEFDSNLIPIKMVS